MANPETKWGASYRLIASEKWKSKSAAMGRDVTQALIEYARLTVGMKVLDLASGTGEPAISLASRVGPEGDVTALDLSGDLLAIAEQRAQQRRLTNFRTCKADAHDLSFPDDAFNLVTCRFGVMFFADCEKALKEVRRVLKPEGRACFLAWGPFEQSYWASTMGIVHKHVGGSLLEPGSANMFRFADPGSLSKLLQSAGFVSIEEEMKQLSWTWPGDAEEVWEYAQAVSTPFRPLLERIPNDKRKQIDAEVLAAVRQFEDRGRIKFGVTVVLASGRKV
ncbi:MAG TPA: class I SAM-dependent methyltransferase [Terriglobales bacterium]|nr:class I SAM-dependent methyltransferase [Terriglobales bacterium]